MRESLFSIVNLMLICGAAFFIALLINSFFLKFAHTLGIRNKNDITIRWSHTSKPSLGGISFYIVFLVGFMFYAIFFGKEDVFENESLLGLFYTVTIAFLLGLSDDAYNTRPLLKLLIQIACGVILITTNNSIEVFGIDVLNKVFTVIWVVAIMNSINMLDNMDGITTITSISIITSIIFILVPFALKNNIDVFFLMTILGALLGFLVFNFPPAKMFMGDTGSQFLGVFLAYFSIKYLWNNGVTEGEYTFFSNLSLVVACFAIPIIDTLIVSINRIARKQSPMVGGKDHTTHHLVYRGLKEGQVFFVFLFLGLISSILTFVFQRYIPYYSLSYSILWIYFIIIFSMFFGMTRRQKHFVENGGKKD